MPETTRRQFANRCIATALRNNGEIRRLLAVASVVVGLLQFAGFCPASEQQPDRMVEARQVVDQYSSRAANPQGGDDQHPSAPQQRRPNIITVFIDDMGWSDLSCYGGTRTKTEHIDRLAEEGLRFTQFYVNSPICSPSRVALSTGQYPHRHRITSYLANRQRNNVRGVAQWLSKDAPVLARELQQAGYATGHFGKWHMGGQRDVGNAPLIREYGFDRSLTNFEGLGPRVLPLKDAYDGKPPKKHDLGSAALGQGPIRWEDRSQVTVAFVEAALEFIDEAQESAKPFFINVWPDDVHSPFFPPQVLREGTDGSKKQLYYAVLDAMDQQLGQLFARVRDDPRLRDNTLILVMSDNGHEEGAGASDPLRGAKTWLYEGGIRSPLIVWGPGFLSETKAGETNDSSVLCALDVNRSLYSFAGIAPEPSQPLDGEDVLPAMLGKSNQGRKSPIFWRRPPDRPGQPDQDNPDLAVRDGKWKYLVNYDGSEPQLYDLIADPSESTNLIPSQSETVQRLHKAVTEWNAEMPRDAGDPQWKGHLKTGSLDPGEFVNPIGEGADPWVIRDPNQPRYLWCMSEGNRAIAVHVSDSLSSMGRKHIVWNAPDRGPVSRQVWAPELHWLDGRWYVYFAASDGKNENHLAYVLKSRTDDPLGEYQLYGPLATGEGDDGKSPNIWAIDMTVLEHGGRRYALWSGWDKPKSDQQYLYIAPMESPTQLAGSRVRLCSNDDHLWERLQPNVEQRGLNEAPQVFQTRRQTAVVYSCGASWLPTYKLGLLELVGDDPLSPVSWKKRPRPAFASTSSTYGVGHSCFVQSLDQRQWWHIFHAKLDREPGWRRAVFVQPMRIGKNGFPLLGQPVSPGAVQQEPTGGARAKEPFDVDAFEYFGHHQFVAVEPGQICLGRTPREPINDYRSGEKVVFTGSVPSDVQAGVTIDFHGDPQSRDAGILFRTTGAAVGYDAQRGYFAGLIPRTQLVILGRMDGQGWQEIARSKTTIDVDNPQQLSVLVHGDRISVWHNGEQKIQHADATYGRGSLGLRVVNTEATFSQVSVRGLSVPAR